MRESQRQTDRQTDRQTGRQTDRQTDEEVEVNKERLKTNKLVYFKMNVVQLWKKKIESRF